jgi:ArsR family transcriptional regulator
VDELVNMAKALSDPTRVRIIYALLDRELCVCELCDALQVTQSTLSTHLQMIRGAGLVSARKEGKWMYYEILPAARRVLEGFFRSFGSALKTDNVLSRDTRDLKRRLAMRDNGSCCIGFKPKAREKCSEAC